MNPEREFHHWIKITGHNHMLIVNVIGCLPFKKNRIVLGQGRAMAHVLAIILGMVLAKELRVENMCHVV